MEVWEVGKDGQVLEVSEVLEVWEGRTHEVGVREPRRGESIYPRVTASTSEKTLDT